MKSRSEEEGRAWLAMNSINDNIFKLFLKYVPTFTVVITALAVIMGVMFAVNGILTDFWNWRLFLVTCASILPLSYLSIKVRRKGVDSFFSKEASESLELLSNKEKRNYQIFYWLASGPGFLFVVVFPVALIAHFSGEIQIPFMGWMAFIIWLLLSVCLLYWAFQRTRRLVSKLTAQLAEEHAPFSVEDSETL
ncbi:MAG: hypothetical protein F4X56_04335 [Gammaproteobacteria bacterium]|nr:hypothetical protein [Gammaproteobacteria bacterium]MYC25131.1 hypothetical protein [Gammaproteobacteria bacterium]